MILQIVLGAVAYLAIGFTTATVDRFKFDEREEAILLADILVWPFVWLMVGFMGAANAAFAMIEKVLKTR